MPIYSISEQYKSIAKHNEKIEKQQTKKQKKWINRNKKIQHKALYVPFFFILISANISPVNPRLISKVNSIGETTKNNSIINEEKSESIIKTNLISIENKVDYYHPNITNTVKFDSSSVKIALEKFRKKRELSKDIKDSFEKYKLPFDNKIELLEAAEKISIDSRYHNTAIKYFVDIVKHNEYKVNHAGIDQMYVISNNHVSKARMLYDNVNPSINSSTICELSDDVADIIVSHNIIKLIEELIKNEYEEILRIKEEEPENLKGHNVLLSINKSLNNLIKNTVFFEKEMANVNNVVEIIKEIENDQRNKTKKLLQSIGERKIKIKTEKRTKRSDSIIYYTKVMIFTGIGLLSLYAVGRFYKEFSKLMDAIYSDSELTSENIEQRFELIRKVIIENSEPLSSLLSPAAAK